MSKAIHHNDPDRSTTPEFEASLEKNPLFRRSLTISTSDPQSGLSGKDKKAQLWEELEQFYNKNEETIRKMQALDLESATKDDRIAQRLQTTLDGFVEITKIVLDGLVCLGNVHPVLGVAIFAFHSVISLDLTRRDNEKKVIVVKLQMQNMMCSMFQLKDLRHAHIQEAGREEQEARLQELIKDIAADITRCGSDLNSFMNRKLVSKIVHARGYEEKFAEHIAKFIQRRAELQIVLTAYIAASIDVVHTTLNDMAAKVDDINNKLEMILTRLFPKLSTAREDELYNLVDRYGGFEEFLKRDDLLTELYAKAISSAAASSTDGSGGGGTQISAWQTSAVTDASPRQREINIKEFKKDLKNEIGYDLNDILRTNFERFEKLLMVQHNNNTERLASQMEQHGYKLDNILTTVTSLSVLDQGKLVNRTLAIRKEKLQDPEFQTIWDQMRLGRSVKAKTFVLTFRDYFLVGDRSTPGTPMLSDYGNIVVTRELSPRPNVTPIVKEDPWVFDYIDVTHVQPIVEAMDEDGSGFISVREANKFASSRPKGISLLHWIAYWAAGWHIDVTYYHSKIYAILVDMHKAFRTVLWANQPYVDDYLNSMAVLTLEGILRSIKPLPSTAEKEPKLMEIVERLRASREELILSNLKEMSYLLQSPADVAVIVGSGRVETWFLPLTYLLLKRHLAIINLSKDHLITDKELQTHSESLDSILATFNDRMHVLQGRFEQIHRDVERQFSIHAYGMFLTSYKNTTLKLLHSKLLEFKYSRTISSFDSEKEPNNDTSILNFGLGTPLSYSEAVSVSSPAAIESSPSPSMLIDKVLEAPTVTNSIEGSWTGVCYQVRNTDNKCLYTPGSFEVVFEVFDSTLRGTGLDSSGRLEFAGSIKNDNDATSSVSFVFTSSGGRIRCAGTYDSVKDKVYGRWSWEPNTGGVNHDSGEELGENHDYQTEDGDAQGEEEEHGNQEDGGDEAEGGEEEVNKEAGNGDAVKAKQQQGDVEVQIADSPSRDAVSVEHEESLDDAYSISDMDIFQSNDSEHLEATVFYEFILTRTPKDVYRFRYLIDHPGQRHRANLAQRRWFFAIEAVLLRVRRAHGFSNAIKTGLAERVKWIELSIRYRLFRYYSTITDNLSGELIDELLTLMWRTPPENAQIYHSLTTYYFRRVSYERYIYCYSCNVPIPFTRFICITCVAEDFDDQIVLCPECIGSRSLAIGKFVHSISHCLICSPVRVHCYELSDVIFKARRRSTRLIAAFKNLETKAKRLELQNNEEINGSKVGQLQIGPDLDLDSVAPTSEVSLMCACCSTDLTLPFWACVSCELDTLFCLKCEPLIQHFQPRYNNSENHSYKHARLLITSENKISTESREIRLEKQLSSMGDRMASLQNGMAALEESVNNRLDAIHAKFLDVAAGSTGTEGTPALGDRIGPDSVESPQQLDFEASLGASSSKHYRDSGARDLSTYPRLPAEEKLAALEENVNRRFELLEEKVDSQLGRLFDLMQEVISATRGRGRI
ncbi:hypothetical protein JR316_0006834 [Psilocybe cubensis]|uniref:EF-hand domain-containing protein n=2 Tax=Psilocybe cubensis TaxID=181762 RepID=A0A8H7XL68_PSICU|nr:hypothetical protein JR316_0006834 [Psilocybe cubensis]KAH9480236.1 hypothetical protein JR316_0006834 [Psilocybe cubensis]